MATAPAFAATPRQGIGTVATAATTGMYGSATVAPDSSASVFAAGGSGSRVDRIRLSFTGTTSAAGFVNVIVTNGTIRVNIRSVAYTAITSSVTVAPALADGSGVIEFTNGLMLPSGYTLIVCFTNGTGVLQAVADGGDF